MQYYSTTFCTSCQKETDDVCCKVVNNQGDEVDAGLIMLEGAKDFVESVSDLYREMNRVSTT